MGVTILYLSRKFVDHLGHMYCSGKGGVSFWKRLALPEDLV